VFIEVSVKKFVVGTTTECL